MTTDTERWLIEASSEELRRRVEELEDARRELLLRLGNVNAMLVNVGAELEIRERNQNIYRHEP